jgi:hypothetical protein
MGAAYAKPNDKPPDTLVISEQVSEQWQVLFFHGYFYYVHS